MFLQSDPLGFSSGTLAIYGYVDQNTFTFADPSGLVVTLDMAQNSSTSAAGASVPVWQIGAGLASTVSRLLNGLRSVSSLIKTYNAAAGFPPGKEPDHCDEKGTTAYTVRRQLRKAYKPLESMKRRCQGLTWDTASDVMERMTRARRGYKLAALRKLELALCHDGGDTIHRGHTQEAIEVAKACMTR